MEAERHAREQAQRANLLKDEFLSVLSHELRTPFSAIQAWGHLLASGKTRPDEIRQAGEVIVRNATVQRRVIDDLLDVGRIVSGRLRIEMEIVDPAQIVQAALDTVRPTASARSIRVTAALEPTGSIRADASRLQQVLWNLLSNAVKFTPEGGEVRLSMEQTGERLRIRVSDNGRGIDPELLPRVFERFAQGDASPSRQHGGLGLGLAIAKQLVELHGGSISAASEGLGQGAAFTVILPLPASTSLGTLPGALPVWGTETIGGGETSDLSGLKVLVVDDEPDALDSLSRTLSDSGATVFTAASAAAALETLRTKIPHVLVSDIGMPEMDGYELLRRIRSLEGVAAEVPAIALTAFARPSDRMHSLRAGYIAHLVKPADPAQLLATISAAAGRVA